MSASWILVLLALARTMVVHGALRGDADNDILTELSMPSSSKDEIGLLVEPMGVEDFFQNYHDKKVAHIQWKPTAGRGGEDRYPARSDFFSRKSLDKLLTDKPIYNEISTRFVIKDEDVDASEHEAHGDMADLYDVEFDKPMADATTRIDPGMVDAHLGKKATMMFKHLEMHVNALKRLTCKLADSFGARSGVNMYLTPPRSTGFLTHYDGHDIFVVQTAGAKCWQICERAENDRLRNGGRHFPGVNASVLESYLHVTCRNVSLVKGDTLYLPRGTLHAPHTHVCNTGDLSQLPGEAENRKRQTEGSMHLSFSVDVSDSRWGSLLEVIVGRSGHTNDNAGVGGEVGEGQGTEETQESFLDEVVVQGRGNYSEYHFSWRLLLEEVLVNATESKTPLGVGLRTTFPSWKLKLPRVSSPENNLNVFGTEGFAHKKTWGDMKRAFYADVVAPLQNGCHDILHWMLLPTLEAHGFPNQDAQAETRRIAGQCKGVMKKVLQTENDDVFDIGVGQLLMRNVQVNNMKCSSNAPVMMGNGGGGGFEGMDGIGEEILEGFGIGHGEEEGLGNDPFFGDYTLQPNDQVHFHNGIGLAIGLDHNTKGNAILTGPLMDQSLPWGERSMADLKQIVRETGEFSASKHSLEITQALVDIGALVVKKIKSQ
jgi:hypothetical protein